VKHKVASTAEKNIVVIEKRNANATDLLNSNSVFLLRANDQKPVTNAPNANVSSMSEVLYFNQANSAVSLPAINR
jgi:hypothetical protein